MASSLSEEEFHRMQLQLIELRTEKYELDSRTKKQEKEIQLLKESAENADKELQKAQKAINKSKKAKEVELLLQENEMFQRKLESQEEDFRVQNQTLMQELSLLVSTNEELEQKLSVTKETSNNDSNIISDTSHWEDEIRRLQAQNSALQKTITGLQEKKMIDPDGDKETAAEEIRDNDAEKTDDSNETDSSKNSENLAKTIEGLRLNLATEAEEKGMLKLELTEKQERYTKEVKSLKEEVEKLTEKLKKKQESYLQIQEEKESIFKENSTKLEELQSSKERDNKYFNDQINRLQQELAKGHKVQDDIKTNSDQQLRQLQNKMAEMQQQIDAADIIEHQHIRERSQKYENHLQELKAQVLTLTQKRDDLIAELEEVKKVGWETSESLQCVQKDRDLQIQALQEANKLAEKRKSMLDDLAIKYQKDCDKHREQMLAMENSFEGRLKDVAKKLEEEQKKSIDLERLKPVVEEQAGMITSLEESKGWLERRLAETEGSLDQTLDEKEVTILELKASHDDELTKLRESHSTEVDGLTTTFQSELTAFKELEESQKQAVTSLEEDIKKLKQEIKDGLNERKVHEKKGKSVLKDLKKQLHAERNRAEKLQERLQEVLSAGSHNKNMLPRYSFSGMEDLFRSPAMNDSWREDQSSISSWSGVGTLASVGTNHSILSGSPSSSPQSPCTDNALGSRTDEMLEQDNAELMGRLGVVQQEKWDLEERVKHLETSTAAMANDLIEKSRIIEHYVMESRTDTKSANPHMVDEKITLKKVLDLVKTDDQGLREMNKKFQNMLEETLTKNMHLQKDLETLSQEVVRLSKLPHSQSSESVGDSPSAVGVNSQLSNGTSKHSTEPHTS